MDTKPKTQMRNYQSPWQKAHDSNKHLKVLLILTSPDRLQLIPHCTETFLDKHHRKSEIKFKLRYPTKQDKWFSDTNQSSTGYHIPIQASFPVTRHLENVSERIIKLISRHVIAVITLSNSHTLGTFKIWRCITFWEGIAEASIRLLSELSRVKWPQKSKRDNHVKREKQRRLVVKKSKWRETHKLSVISHQEIPTNH